MLMKYDKNIPIEKQSRFERWLNILKFGELYADDLLELPEILKNMEGVRFVMERIKYGKSDRELQCILESRRMAEHDRVTDLKLAELSGIEKGIKKGIKEGELRGLTRGKMETAKKMLNEGFDVKIILKITGLSEKEILGGR